MGHCFLVAVHDRKAATLLSLIEPGTAVISDCWKSCERGYNHLRVNHSPKFIDSEPALIPIPLKLPGVTSKFSCLNTIDEEDLKDTSPGICSGKFASLCKNNKKSMLCNLFHEISETFCCIKLINLSILCLVLTTYF
ncbi:hypothetical protein TNCT_226081 [Trichonephila clavata]|uniref:Transposase n=1 Tax=Trichonephila clavata TaxID=2740835 RepID=A0A8X6HS80_TRICU|nr:hypothetical protein TNCT_226081 [Trichonephila clavata]